MQKLASFACALALLAACSSDDENSTPGPDAGGDGDGGGGAGDAAAPEDGGADDASALDDGGGDGGRPPAMMAPIDPPVPDDCITDVGPGDHTFSCGGLTFLVIVPEVCTERACGLIFDVHGGTMSGLQMRDNTHLHELAPPHGYLVVHPSATPQNSGGTWDLVAHPPIVGDFMDRMIAAFYVDPGRIHVTGFSQGSGMTFWFLCHKNDLLASAAPISGQSASAITAPDGSNCIESIDASWSPRVPILFMNGTSDTALLSADARARVDGLVERLGLGEGVMVGGDAEYRRTRYAGDDGMVLEYIEHDYGGQPVLGGHCIPGGTDIAGSANNFTVNATTCTTGEINLHWGEVALEWFQAHEDR